MTLLGVSLVGGTSSEEYHTVVVEADCFALWGFGTYDPASYSQGSRILVHLINYLLARVPRQQILAPDPVQAIRP